MHSSVRQFFCLKSEKQKGSSQIACNIIFIAVRITPEMRIPIFGSLTKFNAYVSGEALGM